MSLSAGTVYVDVRPDTTAMTGKGSSGLGSAMKTAGLLAAGAFAVSFIKGGIEEAKEAEKVGLMFADSLSRGTETFDAAALSSKFDEINNAMGVSDEELQTWAAHFNNAIDFSKFGANAEQMLVDMTALVPNLAAQTGRAASMVERTVKKLGTAPEAAIPALMNMGALTTEQAEKAMKLVEAGKIEEAQMYAVARATENTANASAKQTTESEKLSIAFSEIQEKVGTALIPILNGLASVGIKVIDFFMSGSAASKAVMLALGALTVALVANKIQMMATSAWSGILAAKTLVLRGAQVASTAAQWLFNAAMSANPAAIVVKVLAVLVGLLVLFFTKTKAGRAVFAALANVARTAFNGIKVVVLAVFNVLKTSVVTYFNIYKGAFMATLSIAKTVWNTVKSIVVGAWNGIKAVWSGAKSFFSGIWNGIADAGKAAINTLIGFWNSLDFGFHFTIPDIPGIPGRGTTIGVDDIFPDIGYLAAGGIVTRPSLNVIGEAGREAVIPLGRGRGSIHVVVDNPHDFGDGGAGVRLDGRSGRMTR